MSPIILVTGSSGHLGEALIRVMRQRNINCVGIDVLPSPSFTTHVGSIADKEFITSILKKYENEEGGCGIYGIINTAVLHKPHIVSHSMQDFINVNITGTLTLLDSFYEICCRSSSKIPFENRFFIQTSTTSTYGDSLISKDKSTINWIDESVAATPKNIYGVTKKSGEEICQLFVKQGKIANVFVLQASRFFPEEDDDAERAEQFVSNAHQQFVELFHRRVEIEDLVDVHLLAAEKAMKRESNKEDADKKENPQTKGIFKRYICSAPSPIPKDQKILSLLATRAAGEVLGNLSKLWSDMVSLYPESFGKEILVGTIDRVYCSDAAVEELGWKPKYTAEIVLQKLIERRKKQNENEKEGKSGNDEDDDTKYDWRSELALAVGKKGYHRQN